MRQVTARKRVSVFMSGVLLVITANCGTGGGITSDTARVTMAQATAIRDAGVRLGVPVSTERMVHFAEPQVSWFEASAANLEKIAATELPRGVNVCVAYFDMPGQKFPKGFYKIRAVAEVRQVGRIDGRAELINEKGEIVATLPGKVEVQSMTVPENAASRLTAVTLCAGAACNVGDVTPPIAGFWACQTCPNGWRFCFYVGFLDEFWL